MPSEEEVGSVGTAEVFNHRFSFMVIMVHWFYGDGGWRMADGGWRMADGEDEENARNKVSRQDERANST